MPVGKFFALDVMNCFPVAGNVSRLEMPKLSAEWLFRPSAARAISSGSLVAQ